ncbi:hypothetical protein [Streptomyces pseudogriseolus]|uniref:hypothetical protein n=1 Tax=Streptomyces pseudogriseolus TaxID=36817 RepID=UPI003FA2AFE8
MRLRIGMLALAVLCITGGTVKVTSDHMRDEWQGKVDRMEVDAFNDGFRDGACSRVTFEDGSYVYEDGNGRLCR